MGRPDKEAFDDMEITLDYIKLRTVRCFANKKSANSLKVSGFLHKKNANVVRISRRDRDSNPGYAFDVYTLSRRASSATRASLLFKASAKLYNFPQLKIE